MWQQWQHNGKTPFGATFWDKVPFALWQNSYKLAGFKKAKYFFCSLKHTSLA
jgi:hypothetical protein